MSGRRQMIVRLNQEELLMLLKGSLFVVQPHIPANARFISADYNQQFGYIEVVIESEDFPLQPRQFGLEVLFGAGSVLTGFDRSTPARMWVCSETDDVPPVTEWGKLPAVE
jgi:hypothetical protein